MFVLKSKNVFINVCNTLKVLVTKMRNDYLGLFWLKMFFFTLHSCWCKLAAQQKIQRKEPQV